MADVKDVESGETGVPLSNLTPDGKIDDKPKFGGATEYLNDPPPTYASIFEQIKKAGQESNGMDFGKKASTAVAGSKGCTICTAVVIVVPVTMTAMGGLSVYLQDCPIQRFIPLYLLVFGAFSLLKSLISLLSRCRNHRNNDNEKNAKQNPLEGLITCFLFGWFIAGNYWIYSVYTTVNLKDTSDPNYCQPILYQFAFWVTTAAYMVAGLFVLLACCCCFGVCCCVSKAGGEGKDGAANNAV